MATDPDKPDTDPKPDLIDTVAEPDPRKDPATEIEENGEPFEGNNA